MFKGYGEFFWNSYSLLMVLNNCKMRLSQFGRWVSVQGVGPQINHGGIELLPKSLGARGERRHPQRGRASASAPPGSWGCAVTAFNIPASLSGTSGAARIPGCVSLQPFRKRDASDDKTEQAVAERAWRWITSRGEHQTPRF